MMIYQIILYTIDEFNQTLIKIKINQHRMNIGKLLGRVFTNNYYPIQSAIGFGFQVPPKPTVLPGVYHNHIGTYSVKYSASTRKERVKAKPSTPNHQNRPQVTNLNQVLDIMRDHVKQGNIDKAAKISLGLSNQLYLKGAIGKQEYLAELWQTAGFCFNHKSLDIAESVVLDLLKQKKQQLTKSNLPLHELYLLLGIIGSSKNDYKNAIKYYEKCLESEKGKADPFYYLYILSQIIAMQNKQGNFKQATKRSEQYWMMYDKHRLQENKQAPVVISMIDVVKVEYLHGDTVKAIKYLRQVNELCEKLTDPDMVFKTYDMLIELNQLVEFDIENDKAISRYLALCEDQYDLVNRYLELAFKQINAKWKLKDYSDMNKYAQNLQKFMGDRRIKRKDLLTLLAFYKGISYFGQRNFEQSIKHFENAIKIVNTMATRNQRINLLQLINLAYLSFNTYLLKDDKFIETIQNVIKFVESNKLSYVNLQDLKFLLNREDKGQLHTAELSQTIDSMIKTYIHSKLMKSYIQQTFKVSKKKQ